MDKNDVLTKFQNKELPKAYTKPLTPDEVVMLKMTLHPTKRAASKEATKRLLSYLAEKDIVTNDEIQRALGLAEMTVLKRLQIFRDYRLIKREIHRYYLVTPRLRELVRLHIERL